MGKSIVLLACPSAGLYIVDAGDVGSPVSFFGHLIELAVLHHHCVDDTQEALIAGEDSSSTGQCIALHEALAGMLAEDFDDSSTSGIGKLIPLEIAPGMLEDSVNLIAYQLIRREESKSGWVIDQRLIN